MDANNVRQRLEQVVVQCGFNLVTEKSDHLSHYYEFRHNGSLTMTVIRISNHCIDIQNCGDVNDGSIFTKQIVYDTTKMTNENLVDCENLVKKITSEYKKNGCSVCN